MPMDQTIKDVLYLASCAVNEIRPEHIDGMDLEEIFRIAKEQSLSALISYALESGGYKDEETISCIASALRKILIFEAEKQTLFARLDAAGIWYMPLKGAVLKDDYPALGMREMTDYDILFDSTRAEEVKEILEEQGFTTKQYHTTSNHDVYFKEPVVNFEMHRSLFGGFHDDKLYSYYLNVKDRLLKDEGDNFAYHFTGEDFYIYMIAHEYKHYSHKGIGIRTLVDTYIYLKKHSELDWAYMEEQFEKLGIAVFEKKNRTLAMKLFGGGKIEKPEEDEMLDYMFGAGTYGNVDNLVENVMKKQHGGKLRYLVRRIWLPLETVKKAYPFFYSHKILLPVLPLYRLYLSGKTRKSTVGRELKALQNHKK